MRVRLQRHSLDKALAKGEKPGSRAELACRARQLTSARCRRGLITGLTRALADAQARPHPLTSAVPVQRDQVLDAQAQIDQVVDDLRSRDVEPRGVLQVQALLTSGESPFFNPSAPGALERALRHAHAALLMG
jgi:hypothetical protein